MLLRPHLKREPGRIIFGLLRPNRTRKVYFAITWRRAKYGDFGVRDLGVDFSIFD